MQKPYVAQDSDGGWYADCCGVMQGGEPTRTREQALEWALDWLWHNYAKEGRLERLERLAKSAPVLELTAAEAAWIAQTIGWMAGPFRALDNQALGRRFAAFITQRAAAAPAAEGEKA